MALLTTGNFYLATFLATTNAAWAALDPNFPFAIGGVLGEAIYKAVPTSVAFYVIDSGQGQIAYIGGQAVGFDDTLLNGAAVAMTKFTLDAVDTSQTLWGVDGAGNTYMYDGVAGVLRSFTGGEITAFKAFLP